jgi:hypothetical protein
MTAAPRPGGNSCKARLPLADCVTGRRRAVRTGAQELSSAVPGERHADLALAIADAIAYECCNLQPVKARR